MSDETIGTLIEDLVSEAQTGDIEAATAILEDIVDRFDELRAAERSDIRRSAAARQNEDIEDETIAELTGHLQTGAETQMSRAAFLLEAVSILHSLESEEPTEKEDEPEEATQEPAEDVAGELQELGDRVQTQQETYEEAATRAAETTTETEVPPQVAVESIEAPNTADAGESFDISATVANVGDQTAEDVRLTVDLYTNGDKEERTATVGTLNGGETTSQEWSGISNVETVVVTVESANGGSDGSETTILIEESQTDGRLDQEADDSIPGYVIGSALASLGGAGYVLKRRLDADEDSEE